MNYQPPYPIHLEDDTVMEHGSAALSCHDCPESLESSDELYDYAEACFEATEADSDPSHALQALEVLALADDQAAVASQTLASSLINLLSERANGRKYIDKSLSHLWSSQDEYLHRELGRELTRRTAAKSLGQMAADHLVARYVEIGQELSGDSALEILTRFEVAKNS